MKFKKFVDEFEFDRAEAKAEARIREHYVRMWEEYERMCRIDDEAIQLEHDYQYFINMVSRYYGRHVPNKDLHAEVEYDAFGEIVLIKDCDGNIVFDANYNPNSLTDDIFDDEDEYWRWVNALHYEMEHGTKALARKHRASKRKTKIKARQVKHNRWDKYGYFDWVNGETKSNNHRAVRRYEDIKSGKSNMSHRVHNPKRTFKGE